VPVDNPNAVELQNLVAVLECTSREMIPEKFRKLPRSRIINDIQELKALLGDK